MSSPTQSDVTPSSSSPIDPRVATCSSSYDWANNSRGQDPCTVASFLRGACSSRSYVMRPLPPGGVYNGPGSSQTNVCECSLVVYTLVSACADCQHERYLGWKEWFADCESGLPAPTLDRVPAGTMVPYWAYLYDSHNATYNPASAEQHARIFGTLAIDDKTSTTLVQATMIDLPSMSPELRQPTATTTATSTPVAAAQPASASKAPAIVGGVIGALVIIGLAIASALWLIRRRRRIRASKAPSALYKAAYGTAHPSMVQNKSHLDANEASLGSLYFSVRTQALVPSCVYNRPSIEAT